MNIKINFEKILLFAVFLVAGFFLAAQVTQANAAVSQEGAINWLLENWVPILLIVSEVLAFLPTKWSGLLRGIISLVASKPKKKLPSQSI